MLCIFKSFSVAYNADGTLREPCQTSSDRNSVRNQNTVRPLQLALDDNTLICSLVIYINHCAIKLIIHRGVKRVNLIPQDLHAIEKIRVGRNAHFGVN